MEDTRSKTTESGEEKEDGRKMIEDGRGKIEDGRWKKEERKQQ